MKVLILEDHPTFRYGLRIALQRAIPGIEVYEAPSLAVARDCLSRGPAADLLFADLLVEDGHAKTLLDGLDRSHWPLATIIVTSVGVAEANEASARLSAVAVVVKETPVEQLVRIALGYIGLPLTSEDSRHQLTSREREVLALLAQGLTNRQIGSELGVTVDTTKVHVSSIISKLGVRNRTEAAGVADSILE